MITFKQFLLKEDPLAELAVEMWVRVNITDSKADAKEIANWLIHPDSVDYELSGPVNQLLYDFFGDDMPYDVAKYRAETTPEDWMHYELKQRIESDGIDLDVQEVDERHVSDFL